MFSDFLDLTITTKMIKTIKMIMQMIYRTKIMTTASRGTATSPKICSFLTIRTTDM